MRITTRTDLAMRVLSYCAIHADELARSADIAEACNSSTNHVSRVVYELQGLGYIETVRGRHGGLRLQRAASEIGVGEVFREFEAGIPLAECFDPQTNTCPLIDACRLRKVLQAALSAFYDQLDAFTLQDLVEDNHDLVALVSRANLSPFGCQPTLQ